MGTRPFWMRRRFPPPRGVEGGGPRAVVTYQMDYEVNPYQGWKHYFPDLKYRAGSEAVRKVEAAEKFFRSVVTEKVQEEVEEQRYLEVAVKALEGDALFSRAWEGFGDDLRDDPETTLASLSLALHQVVNEAVNGGSSEEFPAVWARVVEVEPVTGLRSLKAGLLGKLVSVRGSVIRVGSARLQAAWLAFSCGRCGATAAVGQPGGRYRTPTSCPAAACRSRTFSPLLSSSLTTTRSCQTVRIQENTADASDQREGGRVPRTLEVELTDDLVDRCAPGDNVVVTGVVKVRNGEESSGKRKAGGNLYSTYLEGTAVVNGKGASPRTQGNIGVEFSLKDYYAIQEIHEEERLFRLLVNSVCPGVYGHEMVKAGLLLSLVGGADGEGGGRGRGSAHVLVVGDPGLGKTHLLHAAAALAPRGVYVCGNTASSSGLTVTLVKEAGGDYALEAGALVLADNGLCCIDEFDKMTSQHAALLEAMEQQSVSVAKGGVVCSLPARTAVVAAANPSAGHYDPSRSLSDNLRMGKPLLSRFDLVFLLLDRPDEKLDVLLSEHVMALHAGKRRRTDVGAVASEEGASDDSTLAERLKVAAGEKLDYVPQALLRKYIAYVKRWVGAVRVESGAARVLEEYYLGLRGGGGEEGDGAVTARRLEAALRLTRARARVELREAATEADALDVVQLMSWSTDHLSSSSSKSRKTSASRNRSGIGSKAKKLIAALEMRSQLEGRDTFLVSEMKEISTALALNVPDFHGFVSTLNTQGFLLKRGPNLYKLLSA